MTTFSKMIRTGIAAALLLAGITTGAQGFATGGGGSGVGGGRRGLMTIKGTVLCARCSLEEVGPGQSNKHQLYQFIHERGQIVIWVSMVNNTAVWRYFTWPPQIRVRAQDSLFQRLTAEENLLKEVEITGLLSTTRALDIFGVTFKG